MGKKHLWIVCVLMPIFGLLGLCAGSGGSQTTAAASPPLSISPTLPLSLSPSPPTTTVKLIFIHHSTGGNWLADPNNDQSYGGLGIALRDNNYFVSATNYGWGPTWPDQGQPIGSFTDIIHWPVWFTGQYSSTILAALYTENNRNICNPSSPSDDCFGDWSRLSTNPGGENEIIMFKSCFPNSDLYGNPNDPPLAEPDDSFTVANAKAVYIKLLTYFASRQDKLFIVITAPPLQESETAPERAANARAFNNWLVNDWLDGYPHSNVAVFDYYNVLTSNGGDANTNDIGAETGNHHRWRNGAVQHIQTVANNYAAYPSGDSHPTTAGHQKATAEFVSLLNVYYNRWRGGGTPCTALTGVTISGPTSGYTNTQYAFTAAPTPANATTPITYTWSPAPDSGQGTATARYTWQTVETKAITVTAQNCGGSAVDTHTVTIAPRPVLSRFIYLSLVLRNHTSAPPTCAVPLTGVTISGPTSGYTNTQYTFTAAPTPANATLPIAYTWSPAPQSGQNTASATYQWDTTGSKTINVTASNCSGAHTANDDHTITIQGQLPLLGGTLIYPTDFIYLGAFRLPDQSSGGISWSYGGAGMTYYPNGDPGNTDAYPGSLFSISDYPDHNYVSEFSIPVPVISTNKNLADLPTATTLQPFADISGGRQIPGLENSLTVGDVQYYPRQGAQTSDKLYWVMFEYYMPEDEIGHGWSELNLASPQAQGAWRLGNFPTSATNKYLFEIPTAWADAYTPGRYLAAGRNRVPNDGSWGPALYAFGPWNDGNPPTNGSSVAATQMLYYPFDYDNYTVDHIVRDFSHADEWQDGAWLTVGERNGVVFAGMKSLRREYELEYYGDYNVDGCGYKGWHAEPYYAAFLFYDPALLAASVQGEIEPYEIQPYAMLNVEDYMFQQGCRRQTLGGVGYDRAHGLVYVLEKEVMADGAKPIVHVFQVSATPQAADLTPPTAPTNVQATPTSTQVNLSWNAATDNAHLAGYIIYRFGEPIATTPATTYSDDKVNPGTTYTYTVVAWDASNNLSAPANVVGTTPAGADNRMPIIYNLKYSGLNATGITIRWRTDEPATTVLTYEVAYSGDMQVYRNTTPTRQHAVVLTGLTPETNYFVWEVVSADAAGHTNIFHVENWDFNTSPTGTSLNFRPILNGIGSRRVAVGDPVTFTLEAFDRDSDDTLTFSAAGLPSGATFNPATRRFSWTPSTIGTYHITFTVSDGDQTDSERVTIFVTVDER